MPTTKGYFTKTATAQAAAPQPKARKPRATKVEVEDATIIHDGDPINPAPGSEGHKAHSAWQRVQQAVDDAAVELGVDGWKRDLVNFTMGLIGYGATLYLGIQLVNVLCAATMLYAGVGFLSFMCAFLGMCAAFFAAWAVGGAVYKFAAAFDVNNVKQRASALFGRFNRSEVSHA